MKSIIVPKFLLKRKAGRFVFETDPKLKQQLENILKDNNTQFVFNIDGKTNNNKKVKAIYLDYPFFSVLPKNGNYIFNISNAETVTVRKNWKWDCGVLKSVTFNFDNITNNYIQFWPDEENSKNRFENLIFNLNNSPAAIQMYSNSIDNLKITQNKIPLSYTSDYTTDETGRLAIKEFKDQDHIYKFNQFTFQNLSQAKTIDLTQLPNLPSTSIEIMNVKKDCIVKLPDNIVIDKVQKHPTTIPTFKYSPSQTQQNYTINEIKNYTGEKTTMKKYKYLSEQDVQILKENFVQPLTNGKLDTKQQEQEIDQIDRFLKDMIFTCNNKKISRLDARIMLGDKQFLSGVDRAVFHWSATRESESGQLVSFDASKCWEKVRKEEERSR